MAFESKTLSGTLGPNMMHAKQTRSLAPEQADKNKQEGWSLALDHANDKEKAPWELHSAE